MRRTQFATQECREAGLKRREFHQPQGAAWFDDLSLSSGNGTGRNLLAAPSFEEEDSAAAGAQAISERYENQVQTLLNSVAAAAKSVTPVETLSALGKQVEDVAASVTDKGLAAYFPRELRDLEDTREKLELCSRVVAGQW